jgi:2-oxoacid:acceptor oxidoreductase delta subunit (pyruvate/2-ketoisovalerate family)
VLTSKRETLLCDTVLLALGQSADLSLLPEGWELGNGRLFRDGQPLPVFAAGDVATGDGTVTHAIGDGRRVAGRLLEAIGVEAEPFVRPDKAAAVPVTDIRLDHFVTIPPAHERRSTPETRSRSFNEVSRGLADGMEAHRCFSCGDCTSCDTCLVFCPEGIIRRKDAFYEVDYSYCKGCGICVKECPRKGMEMVSL